jgi:hypothetical protein
MRRIENPQPVDVVPQAAADCRDVFRAASGTTPAAAR